MYCWSPCPQPCSRPPPAHTFTGDSWTPTGKSGSVSCGVTAPFSWVLVHKVLLCPPRDYFPVLCKFWHLCGGINGDLLQEGLFHTQICCTQSSWGRPPPTCTFTGDAQTQFCLSLCGVPGSWCTQGLFEPFERLWWEWGLILNVVSPLLSYCWGFSFALGHGVSLHSHSSAYCLWYVDHPFINICQKLVLCGSNNLLWVIYRRMWVFVWCLIFLGLCWNLFCFIVVFLKLWTWKIILQSTEVHVFKNFLFIEQLYTVFSCQLLF